MEEDVLMLKSFLIGGIPIGLFMYLGVFHTAILFYIIMIGGLALASYLLGEAFREEFGDRSGKEN